MVKQSQIKNAGIPQRSLKEIVAEEYKKCATDATYFMRKYCYIQHPQRGKILFDLYDFQIRTLKEFQLKDYNIVLKSRQLGLSTLVAGYSLWLMLFHSDKNILVIATKQAVAKNLVTKVRVMHDNLPSWLKSICVEDNKLSLAFSNGSVIKAESSAPEAGRSEALSLLVLDEAAFIKDIDSIWAASSMTLATGGKAIILSTPNGVGNFFHKMWQAAEEGKLVGDFGFNPIKLSWQVHPERDQRWRDKQEEIHKNPRKAAQECDCDFISSGNTVVAGETIKFYMDTRVKEPVEKQGIDHNLWIWEYPDYSRTYIVAADVARGDGSDYSAFQVLDAYNMTQVAEYKGYIGTKEYGNLLVDISTKYNDALLVIENESYGWATIQQVIDRGYKNLLYTSTDMMRVDVQAQLERSWDMRDKVNTQKLVAGVTMGSVVRGMVISKINEYFFNKEILVYSKRLIGELFTWIYIPGPRVADHMDGYNDDTIMSLGIALLVRDTALKLRQQGIELQKQALSQFRSTKMVYTPAKPQYNYWDINVRGHEENLHWLIEADRLKPKVTGSVENKEPEKIMPIARG